MKKRLTLGIFLVSFTFLFGCTGVIELTDAENRAIAEYSAELLLKHAAGYESKYFEGEQDDETAAENTTELVTEGTTEAPTETNTTAEGAATPVESDTDASTEQTVSYETDVSRIIGLADIAIQFNNYQITDRYPSVDKNGEFIYLEVPDGMKLIVVEFDINNLVTEPVDVDLLSMDVSYSIVMNQTKTAKSMLTILTNDLSTYEATLAPGASEKAVLVFQISDSLVDQIQTLDMKVAYGGSEGMMKVK